MTTEEHPLEPFLPGNARVLFLGSFPPPKARWSMEFFYPNWINDFWRIMGLIHFGDKAYFEKTPSAQDGRIENPKSFDKERIVQFCREKGIALFDTARKVCRLKDNADDNFLEIVEGTDVLSLLEQLPECRTIVTTGGKASEELQSYFESHGLNVKIPKVGESVEIEVSHPHGAFGNTSIRWWRMPSSSRAYPIKLEKKADLYSRLFRHF